MTQAPTPGPLSGDDIGYVRYYWSAICDSDWHLIPADIRDDLEERLVAVGLAEWRAVTDDDLEDTFAYERGIEKGRPCLDLTALGHLAFKSDESGWMPWSGGENPVPGQMVECKTHNGRTWGQSSSESLRWSHSKPPSGSDIIAFRLTPTAPVKASGSEREAMKEALAELKRIPAPLADDGELTCWDARNEVAAGIHAAETWLERALNLRPQPSGETRALLERIAAVRARKDFTPQQANAGLLTVLDDCAAALSTTPARAEAQDEGAAGEPYGWIYERLDVGPGWCAGDEWWPAEFTRKAPTPGRSRNIITLYAHPSPTPAADVDRVRIAVEALEKIKSRRSIVFGGGEMSGKEAFDIATEALSALKSEGK